MLEYVTDEDLAVLDLVQLWLTQLRSRDVRSLQIYTLTPLLILTLTSDLVVISNLKRLINF